MDPQVWKSFVDNKGLGFLVRSESESRLTCFFSLSRVGHDQQCFPNVNRSIYLSVHNSTLTFGFLLFFLGHQLQILNAKPGLLEASLKIEPYNRPSPHPSYPLPTSPLT